VNNEDNISYRTYKQEDKEFVKKLVGEAFPQFLDGQFWDWKYQKNPDFDPSLIMVAEAKGRIIGCNHWLLKKFVLSPTVQGKIVLGGDLAVCSEYRSKGVGSALLRSQRNSQAMKILNPPIIYTFAVPSLASHLHSPVAGYIPIKAQTATYYKIIGWKMIARRAKELNEEIAAGKFKNRSRKLNLRLLFRISKTPPLRLELSETGVAVLDDSAQTNFNVTISGSSSTFQKIRYSKNIKKAIIKAVLTGKLRIKGKPQHLVALQKNAWLLQEVLKSRQNQPEEKVRQQNLSKP
jgi:GNAT superfamily N-acetyltransferase